MNSVQYKPVHGGYPGAATELERAIEYARRHPPKVYPRVIRKCDYCAQVVGGAWVCIGACSVVISNSVRQTG